MGSSELGGWREFWAKEPWGPHRDNFHAALICSLIANAFRGKGAKAVTPADFMMADKAVHQKRKTNEFIGWLMKVATPKKDKRGVK